MATIKRKILDSLGAQSLRSVADGEDIYLPDRRALNAMRNVLSRKRRFRVEDLLVHLSRKELKAACRALGLDDGGRAKAVLRQRILGLQDRNAATPNTPPTPRNSEGRGRKRSPTSVLRAVRSWREFVAELALLENKEKGDAFELLVKYYLQIEPKYSNLEEVWLYDDVPASVRKRLRLPVRDEGVDLIAKTNEGEYWTVQAKYRSEANQTLTWTELSTFAGLAFGVAKNISHALLCTSADRVTKLLRDLDHVSHQTGDVWWSLDQSFFDEVHRRIAKKPTSLDPYKPRPHQEAAIGDALAHYGRAKQTRGKLILPCGAGKSLTGYWIAEALHSETTLVAVPSISLVGQTLKVWLREIVAKEKTAEVNWICVCSDPKEVENKAKTDELVEFVHELGVDTHTDPERIAKWLRRNRRKRRVVFTTYHSGPVLAAAAKKSRTTFDLGIMDEAHRTAGRQGKVFSHLLYDENLKISRRLFMTATERVFKGNTSQIVGMDDMEVYGETFHLLSFKRALEISPPILCDYEILTLAIDSAEVARLIDKEAFVSPKDGRWKRDKAYRAKTVASAIALRKAMMTRGARKAITFHSSIRGAESFCDLHDDLTRKVRGLTSLETYHVSSKQRAYERKDMLQGFEGAGRALVTNARCLGEGVDIPAIDCVMFVDPRQNTVDVVQAVGRALRTARGKTKGYVVIPLLVQKGQTPGEVAKGTGFAELVKILRQLASNDDSILDELKAIAEGGTSDGGKLQFDSREIDPTLIDPKEFARAVGVEAWGKLARLAWRPFEEAREFAGSLGLSGESDWREYCTNRRQEDLGRRPPDIPTNPSKVYEGWIDWGDWLRTGNVASQDLEFLPYEEARVFAHSLGLSSEREWRDYKARKRPDLPPLPRDIPANPNQTYRECGWKGMGDWLGTGAIAPRLKTYRPFVLAREFAQGLGLRSSREWRQFSKGELPDKGTLPADIPANPNQTYKDKGWEGMGDWLGTGTLRPQDRSYRPFPEARELARSLDLANGGQWRLFCKGQLPDKGGLPEDIPATPSRVYRDQGWLGMGNWLGTGTVQPQKRLYRPFKAARRFVQGLALQSRAEWSAYKKGLLPGKGQLPEDIPSRPGQVYQKSGWQGMGDWLGTGTESTARRTYRSFEGARQFVHDLNLRGEAQWRQYSKGLIPGLDPLPPDIPKAPWLVYKEAGWTNWGDFLGTGKVANYKKQFLPFREARTFARSLGLKNSVEWREFWRENRPAGIPSCPWRTYRGRGWTSLGDWLGTGRIADRSKTYRHFPQAREWAHSLGLRSNREWRAFCKGEMPNVGILAEDVPASPERCYRGKGWRGWKDWLGTG